MPIEYRATLVFTGRLKTGNYSFNIPTLVTLWTVRTPGFPQGNSPVAFKGAINVQASACTLTSGANQSVVLPSVPVYEVDDMRTAPFSMAVQWPTGTKVFATMTDVSAPLNTANVLSLANSSSAKGVGIQIYREDTSTPVSFGPDSPLKGNLNQWYVGTATEQTGGRVGLSFTAGYVKTQPKITPGAVNAQSTITFSYQ